MVQNPVPKGSRMGEMVSENSGLNIATYSSFGLGLIIKKLLILFFDLGRQQIRLVGGDEGIDHFVHVAV